MSRLLIFALVTSGAVALFSDFGRASEAQDKAQEAFEALYGEDFKRVTSSRDVDQAVALAARLFEAAKGSEAQPELMALLAARACELGARDPKGYDTALGAADLVSEKAPDLAGPCQENVIALRQRQYAAGRGDEKTKAGETLVDALAASAATLDRTGDVDEAAKRLHKALGVARAIRSSKADALETQVRAMDERQKAVAKATQLKAQVQADPANAKARDQLVRLLVVDLDRPAEAATCLDATSDATLRKFVPAAAKPVAEAPELACLELADWYMQLAATAGPAGKGAMFVRARAYYERFLSMHSSADLDRTKASLALNKIEEDIKKAGRPPRKSGAGDVWADVLALVDPARDASEGKWLRKGQTIVAPVAAPHTKIVIPVAPQGNYKLQARFVRVSGTDSVGFILPVGVRGVTLLMSAWYGHAAGLGNVNGRDAASNETSIKPHTLENGHEYQLNVEVAVTEGQARVTATLDGKPLIDWKGPESALSHQGLWGPPRPGFLAVGFSNSTGAFNSIRLKMASGEAKGIRADGAIVPLPK